MSKKIKIISAAVILLIAGLCSFALAAEKITISLVTAGDQNMVDLFQNYLCPEFNKEFPDITVTIVGTGPGDPGSQKIVEKLKAQKMAEKDSWDIDVGVIHQIGASVAARDRLLAKFAPNAKTYKYVTSPSAKTALGTNVEGYVIPMFQSQTALAYNPKYVTKAPRTFQELVAWTKKNPQKFGYNGLKNGMSGVSFVASWLYWKTNKYNIFAIDGPYDKSYESSWESVFNELNEFNKNVVITAGNAGTLDMLSRGEIWMGPVWVDMFYTWVADGRLDPEMRLILPAPGMAGQPMYYIVPARASHQEEAVKFIEFVTSPEIQAKYIVEKYNWYPGIDGKYLKKFLSKETWKKLYQDISPEDLLKYGKAFPLRAYYDDMMEFYEIQSN